MLKKKTNIALSRSLHLFKMPAQQCCHMAAGDNSDNIDLKQPCVLAF